MLTRPSFIPADLAAPALEYEWDHRIAISMRDPDLVPQRLSSAVAALNYKAAVALGLACLEWVAWRLEGKTDITDALNRLEAAWASTFDLHYARSLDLDDVSDSVVRKGDPDGLRQTLLIHLEDLHFNFAKSRSAALVETMKCARVAQYVVPPASGFESWLQRTLASLAASCPVGAQFDLSVKSYAHASEPAVPRDWFDAQRFDLDDAARISAWNAFLRGLDTSDNPYLVPADEMIAEGFAGRPYQGP